MVLAYHHVRPFSYSYCGEDWPKQSLKKLKGASPILYLLPIVVLSFKNKRKISEHGSCQPEWGCVRRVWKQELDIVLGSFSLWDQVGFDCW